MQSFFDIFSLPADFPMEESVLEKAYFSAQRAVHPDRLIGKNEAERRAAIQHSERVNQAYETLKDPIARAEHLLALHGIAIKEVGNAAVLMEMMELREQLESVAADGRRLLALVEDVKRASKLCMDTLTHAFASADYTRAAGETMRLRYLTKALEEAYMLLYRLKATAHE